MSEDFNPNEVNYDGVEPSPDLEFRKFRPGTFSLKIDSIEFEKDDKNRGVLVNRYSLLPNQAVELIKEEGDEMIAGDALKPGSVFDRFYFHTPKAIPMFAAFLEKMGLSWEDYKNSTDKKAYVASLKDHVFRAIVILDEYEGKTNNKIKKYLKD